MIFRECLEKFGDSIGTQIWDAVNECFDVMSIAATVDDKVNFIQYLFLSRQSMNLYKLYLSDNYAFVVNRVVCISCIFSIFLKVRPISILFSLRL